MGCIQSQSFQNINSEYDSSDAMVWEEVVPNVVEEKPENQPAVSSILDQTTPMTQDLIQISCGYLFSQPPEFISQSVSREILVQQDPESKVWMGGIDFCHCQIHYPVALETTELNYKTRDLLEKQKYNSDETREICISYDTDNLSSSYLRIRIPQKAPKCLRCSSFNAFQHRWFHSDQKQIKPQKGIYRFKNGSQIPSRLLAWDCDPGKNISGFFYVNGYGLYHLNLRTDQHREICYTDFNFYLLMMIRIPRTGFLVTAGFLINVGGQRSQPVQGSHVWSIVVICPRKGKELQRIVCPDPKFQLKYGHIEMKIDIPTRSVHVGIKNPPDTNQPGQLMIWTCVLSPWFFAPTCPCCLHSQPKT